MPSCLRWTCLLAGLALVLSACGRRCEEAGEDPAGAEASATATPAPTRDPASKADVEVIKGWTDALRHGHVKEASRYLGAPGRRLQRHAADPAHERADVDFFNRSLPCGATFKEAVDTGAFVVATLVLTERPGPGRGAGRRVGNEAFTAFLIRRHKIVQWRRVVEPAPQDEAPAGSAELSYRKKNRLRMRDRAR